MIQEICKDEKFLAQKAEQATPDDIQTATDLLETLEAHKDGCVGMAANMIGVNKRIIAFDNEGTYMVMFNPQIVKQSGGYEAEEGCLSLTGTRKTRRWQSIKVQYQNEKFQTRLKTFTGWTAQIIQHEIDHCNHYLRKKQNVNQRIQKGTPNGVPFFCRSRKRRQWRTAVRRFNSLKKSGSAGLFLYCPCSVARSRLPCRREGDIPQSFYGTLWVSKGDSVPLRRRFSPAARSYPVRKGRGNADGTRFDPPALRCWRPRGSCPCRAPWQSSQ